MYAVAPDTLHENKLTETHNFRLDHATSERSHHTWKKVTSSFRKISDASYLICFFATQ